MTTPLSIRTKTLDYTTAAHLVPHSGGVTTRPTRLLLAIVIHMSPAMEETGLSDKLKRMLRLYLAVE